jgi:predicted CoA-substrate-specific enzyme activase
MLANDGGRRTRFMKAVARPTDAGVFRRSFTSMSAAEPQSPGASGGPAVRVGLDIGSVSCKLAVLDAARRVAATRYLRHRGKPLETSLALLTEVRAEYGADRVAVLALTGAGARLVADILHVPYVNEIIAISAGVRHIRPDVRTVIEIGGQDSKLIQLADDAAKRQAADQVSPSPGSQSSPSTPHSGSGMEDFVMNAICAAGTGSFLDQQANRLGVSIEGEFGALALRSEAPPRVAGRCSVFAKSDMIHLQQQGTPDYDIIAGLCFGMARNFKADLAKGQDLRPPLAFVGGVAANAGMVRAFRSVLGMDEQQFIIPDHFDTVGAIGAVLSVWTPASGAASPLDRLEALDRHIRTLAYTGQRLESLTAVAAAQAAREAEVLKAATGRFRPDGKTPAYLGIDVGSISTCLAVVDDQGLLLAKRYLWTAGRPLEAVKRGLAELAQDCADRVEIRGVGTTGSGRYLTGDFVGADTVRNEITAQATAAVLIDPLVDTIFEIGGQDSKYISLENGVVVDFEMNHVCAAGTGSFLEEQAEKLGIRIDVEFGQLALSARQPVRLGERCTVFMESDLVHHQQQGANRDELVAGLSYSIVMNYLNRVVSHRKIGEHIFFQGGTAFNRGVVAAFEKVTGRPITVPPHHEMTGAIGAAWLARQDILRAIGKTVPRGTVPEGLPPSRFRGFQLAHRTYKTRTFECRHCSNHCEIKEVRIEGERPLFYGSRCDRYNVKDEGHAHADLPDLFAEREALLLGAGVRGQGSEETEGAPSSDADSRLRLPRRSGSPSRGSIGLPRTLYFHQQLPYWRTLLEGLGFDVVLSAPTNKTISAKGVESVLSQTCFPVKVAHGHVLDLLEAGVDTVFLPSIVMLEGETAAQDNNRLCPYVQTIPYQVRTAIDFTAHGARLAAPVIDFLFPKRNAEQIAESLADFGVTADEVRQALSAADAAQDEFERRALERGRAALAALQPGVRAVVLISRPYNGCDLGLNLDLPAKLRALGVLPIPMDFLPVATPDPTGEWASMYWRYGRQILRAAQIVRADDRLNAIYITNFGCGPDSFLATFFKEIMGDKPALILEIDEHSADAGVVTRLEAFLDSLGNARVSPARSAERVIPIALTNGEARTLYIPNMCDQAYALAAAFRACGMDARVMAPSDERSLELGRRYTLGKECLPAIITTGDMLREMEAPDFDAGRAAFFMPGGSGPCRFGQYHCLHRLVLKAVGRPDVPIFSPNQGHSFYNDFRTLKKDPTRLGWQGIVSIDLLTKALHATRPYETEPGATDRAYRECRDDLCRTIETGGKVVEAMRRAADRFAVIPVDRRQRKPLIGIVGEIYVRSHAFSNQDLIRQLEALGAETSLASFGEWIYYTNSTRALWYRKRGRWGRVALNFVKDIVQRFDERRLARPFRPMYGPLAEPKSRELLDLAEPYLHRSFEGEAVLSIGKMVEYYHQEADGIVNCMPFTCMPGNIVTALVKQVRRDLNHLPAVSIAYDGAESPSAKTRLEAFVHQARDFMLARPSAEAHAHTGSESRNRPTRSLTT